jgi:hypothetical protein
LSFPFSANKRKLPFAISSVSLTYILYICIIYFIHIRKHIQIHIHITLHYSRGTLKTEAQAVFLNSFTVCSSYKRKFAVSSFVDKETNRSYPFANGPNGLSYLCPSTVVLSSLRVYSTYHTFIKPETNLYS